MPLFAVHDEVGAVAMCLEICRQARVHGAERLAGAVRLRGGSADHTTVLSRVPEQRGSDDEPPSQSPLPARRTGETG